MAAFSASAAQNISNNIRTLYARRRAVGQMHMTHEEFLQLLVPAPDRDLYRAMAPLAFEQRHWKLVQIQSPVYGTLEVAIAQQDVPGSCAPPTPRSPTVQADTPEDLLSRFNDWIANGADSSGDYGRVQKVFYELNAICSKQVMRYYWPSIIAICSVDDKTKGYASELQELKTPSSPKPLPAGLLQACKKTAETISTVQLIDPTFVPEAALHPVTLEIRAVRKYNEPIGEFWGMQ